MAAFTSNRLRVLGLGNEILADDAFGIWAARAAQRRYGAEVEVAVSSETGFNLLDKVLDASRLLVLDTISTGHAAPGTVYVFSEDEIRVAPGTSPHFIGLFEVLAAARMMGLRVPAAAAIVAVEAADCTTVGGPMHPDVAAAMPAVLDCVGRILQDGSSPLRAVPAAEVAVGG